MAERAIGIGHRARRAHPLVFAWAILTLLVPVSTRGQSQEAAGQSVLPPIAETSGNAYYEGIYLNFYNSYRLGPGDAIAVRVLHQPDYSLDKIPITPVGCIYHPLLGDVRVAGYTIPELTGRLTAELREYVIDPKVSVALVEARSAKIAVLGEVNNAGIFVLDGPQTLLEAISAAGGFTSMGKQTRISLVRQTGPGRFNVVEVNIKRVLEGRGNPEDNPPMKPGDTVLVHHRVPVWLQDTAAVIRYASMLAWIWHW